MRRASNKLGKPSFISGNYNELWIVLVERVTPNVLMIKAGVSRENVNPRKAGGPASLMLRSRRFLGLIIFTNVNEQIILLGKSISWEAR
jgi:hypothetical protein